MARRKRRTYTKTKKSSSVRAKPIKLDPDIWLRNSKDIALYRDKELLHQDYKCGISGLPLTVSNSCLDHCHFYSCGGDYQKEGKVRGVLERQINLLEGQFLKSFKRSGLQDKYGLIFSEVLMGMAEYLQEDNKTKPYHPEIVTTLRKHMNRLNRAQITERLLQDFNIVKESTEVKRDLVHYYCQAFVDTVEENDGKDKEKP